ncbi:MAG: shikimate kinase [Pseudomonadota bacterium]|jgi:shikimate kinase
MNLNPPQNIVLIGLMGAGKTTVGRRLAHRIGWPLIDTDHEIELRSGADIATIFEMEGEEGFRKREERAVAEAMSESGRIVTTGGGAPMREANRSHLAKGYVIYLDAQPWQIWQRLRTDRSRPLLSQSPNPKATLERLHAERDPVYRQVADYVLPSSRGSLAHVVQHLVDHLSERGWVLTESEGSL